MIESSMPPWPWAAVAAAAVSGLVTGLWYRSASWHGIVDVANRRSSHEGTVPRGGGVGICAGIAVGTASLWLSPGVALASGVGVMLGCAVLIAAIGLVDDARELRARTRLLVQLVAAGVLVAVVGPLRQLALPGMTLDLGLLAVPLSLLWLVGVTNAYNFMDGIDGLAAGQGAIAGLTLFLLATDGIVPGLGETAVVVGAACVGFLGWNFPPARIFMGDVGSGTLGFFFAGAGLLAARAGAFPLVAVVLALGAFLFDTAFTLARRILAGETWYRAHRSHVYQRYIGVGFSHLQVTMAEYVIAGALAVAGMVYARSGPALQAATLASWLAGGLVALGIVTRLERGRESTEERTGG